jgi:hypothetical protein
MNSSQRRQEQHHTAIEPSIRIHSKSFVPVRIEALCLHCGGAAGAFRYQRLRAYQGSVSAARSRERKELVYTECDDHNCGYYRCDDSPQNFEQMQANARAKLENVNSNV